MDPHRSLSLFVIISCTFSVQASDNSHKPRVTVTAKDVRLNAFQLIGNNTQIELLQGPQDSVVYAVGQSDLFTIDFQRSPVYQSVVRNPVSGGGCSSNDPKSPDCQYNITVLLESNVENQLFLCGINRRQTLCCYMNSSNHNSDCKPFKYSIPFQIKAGEPSLLIGTSGGEFYTTHSGTEGPVGIHKFGEYITKQGNTGTEQRYLGLVLSGQREEPLQDKIYAFYIEKNPDQSPDSDLWVSRVAQVCMADRGGPKTFLQFMWTSMLSARLSCGNHISKQYFTQLLDVTTVEGDRWQETRLYALFTNGWGMSAVCVYTMGDIDHTFTTSDFEGYTGPITKQRPGKCVEDSRKLGLDALKVVAQHSKMKDWVKPINNNTGPLLVSHRHYRHIRVDRVRGKGNVQYTVLFLSLESGGIHKVLETDDEAFIIAEFQPFTHGTRPLSMMLNSSTRKLYVSSSSEVVQIDLGNCGQHGGQCEDCVLARDPYCGWNGTHCSPATGLTIRQDVDNGNHRECMSTSKEHVTMKVHRGAPAADRIQVPLSSKYFLSCPTLSNHAGYSWEHHGTSTPCDSYDPQCLMLIDSMSLEQEGIYSCLSEERGYHRTLAQYKLESGTTGLASCSQAWVGLLLLTVTQALFT